MIKLVHSYLTKNYIVTKGVDGDYLVYYINTNPLELVYWFKLSTELTSIFSLDEEEIKLLVSHWAYSINEEANCLPKDVSNSSFFAYLKHIGLD